MKFTSILLSLFLIISCGTAQGDKAKSAKDTVVIEYIDSKDTLIIDTLKKKVSAKNRWTHKCEAYKSWNES